MTKYNLLAAMISGMFACATSAPSADSSAVPGASAARANADRTNAAAARTNAAAAVGFRTEFLSVNLPSLRREGWIKSNGSTGASIDAGCSECVVRYSSDGFDADFDPDSLEPDVVSGTVFEELGVMESGGDSVEPDPGRAVVLTDSERESLLVYLLETNVSGSQQLLGDWLKTLDDPPRSSQLEAYKNNVVSMRPEIVRNPTTRAGFYLSEANRRRIHLSTELLRLELAKPVEDAQATLFVLLTVVAHEFGHYVQSHYQIVSARFFRTPDGAKILSLVSNSLDGPDAMFRADLKRKEYFRPRAQELFGDFWAGMLLCRSFIGAVPASYVKRLERLYAREDTMHPEWSIRREAMLLGGARCNVPLAMAP